MAACAIDGNGRTILQPSSWLEAYSPFLKLAPDYVPSAGIIFLAQRSSVLQVRNFAATLTSSAAGGAGGSGSKSKKLLSHEGWEYALGEVKAATQARGVSQLQQQQQLMLQRQQARELELLKLQQLQQLQLQEKLQMQEQQQRDQIIAAEERHRIRNADSISPDAEALYAEARYALNLQQFTSPIAAA
eukprot:COSAG06_NODE_4708_length_4022_cov_1005.070609_2_plen_188_part_00